MLLEQCRAAPLQTTRVHEYQAASASKVTGLDLMAQRHQRFSGIHGLQRYATAGFAGPDKLQQLPVDLGKTTTTGLQQPITGIRHAGLTQDCLHLLGDAMISGHRHGPVDRMSAGLSQYQAGQGGTRAGCQP
ncbi:hypothetical protein D9M68_903430 [compost metagenome]